MSTKKSNFIMTVDGPVRDTQFGFCHSHEHLFIAEGQSAKVNPALRIDSFSKTLAELELYRKAGGRSIVDAQPVGCGRMADLLVRASRESEVRIVAATGFHKLTFYPSDHWIHSFSADQLAQLFQTELENGMYLDGDSSIPSQRIPALPGVIKTASDLEGITPKYRKLFEAAAWAARQTGTPILSHTEMGKAALDQIRLFLDYGLPAESIIICHLDRTLMDLDYQLRVAASGVYLEFDTIGRFKYHSDEKEVDFIVKLVERGYEDRILLGLDVTRERMKNYGGNLGLDYIAVSFLPMLKKAGLPDEVIAKFTIHNPAQAFQKVKTT